MTIIDLRENKGLVYRKMIGPISINEILKANLLLTGKINTNNISATIVDGSEDAPCAPGVLGLDGKLTNSLPATRAYDSHHVHA